MTHMMGAIQPKTTAESNPTNIMNAPPPVRQEPKYSARNTGHQGAACFSGAERCARTAIGLAGASWNDLGISDHALRNSAALANAHPTSDAISKAIDPGKSRPATGPEATMTTRTSMVSHPGGSRARTRRDWINMRPRVSMAPNATTVRRSVQLQLLRPAVAAKAARIGVQMKVINETMRDRNRSLPSIGRVA